LFADFVGRALSFLQSSEARKMGFSYDKKAVLPCKWKCADESIFQVDLALYAYTGLNPFNKGLIGGFFNPGSLGAAVHHGSINIDFGGSHVGYHPGSGGGSFGRIWRPQMGGFSSDCGHLIHILQPFVSVYDDACKNILLYSPAGEEVLISIPNEFLQPNWSSHHIKLMVDLETLTDSEVTYQDELPHTHTPIARSLFHVSREFLANLEEGAAAAFKTQTPTPIGWHLRPEYFTIFDDEAELDEEGLPKEKLLLYMKYIVGAKHSPPALKAAIINTNLEHSRLTDAVRDQAFAPYTFASFTGIFIDLFDQESGNYQNLFQPIGMSIKPSGQTKEVDLPPEEIHHHLEQLRPVEPRHELKEMLGLTSAARVLDKFTYRPGLFQKIETD
ncbi:MAG: hypothetical protein MI702_06785, partial [Chlorobiales bacterium]|nr:hypothetical protein [Chlorobiales bacterium]